MSSTAYVCYKKKSCLLWKFKVGLPKGKGNFHNIYQPGQRRNPDVQNRCQPSVTGVGVPVCAGGRLLLPKGEVI